MDNSTQKSAVWKLEKVDLIVWEEINLKHIDGKPNKKKQARNRQNPRKAWELDFSESKLEAV